MTVLLEVICGDKRASMLADMIRDDNGTSVVLGVRLFLGGICCDTSASVPVDVIRDDKGTSVKLDVTRDAKGVSKLRGELTAAGR